MIKNKINFNFSLIKKMIKIKINLNFSLIKKMIKLKINHNFSLIKKMIKLKINFNFFLISYIVYNLALKKYLNNLQRKKFNFYRITILTDIKEIHVNDLFQYFNIKIIIFM